LTDAIRLDAKNAAAYYMRGLAEFTNAHRDRAVADITEAARLDPQNPQFTATLKKIKPDR
jgi:cytochrome c-type biogenesis protein CcmH/NrfG